MSGLAPGGLKSAGLPSGDASFSGDILPDNTNTRSLGSAALRWASLFLTSLKDSGGVARLTVAGSGSSVHHGAAANSGTNTAHKMGNSNTLGTSTRIVEFHNDAAMAAAESWIQASDGSLRSSATAGAKVVGEAIDGASAVGVSVGSNASYTTQGAKLLSVTNASTEKLAVGFGGKFMYPTPGAADVRGTATMVGGTVTVSTSQVKTGDLIFTSRNTTGGTAGHLNAPVASIVDGTSFVINSSSGTDTSTVNWWIVT